MLKTRIFGTRKDGTQLLETYSDEGFKLLQNETGNIYGESVIDVVTGYEEGEPVIKYSYTESEEKEEEIDDEL